MKDIPKHIGIIMDGNGRYAKERKKLRSFGHMEGAKRVEPICRYCDELGVKYLTLYAFSTENYKRPKTEVEKIMSLLYSYIETFFKPMIENNMRFLVIGDRNNIEKKLLKRIENIEEKTKDNTGLNLILAINYGGKNEIVRAVNKLIVDNKEEITEQGLESALDTAEIPAPDLIIRTGGEKRLSNFLLWQCAYSELYFCDTYWPEFMEHDLLAAIEDYQSRKRRFGGL